jgi:caffeoyl-CoA O-methyltransferase
MTNSYFEGVDAAIADQFGLNDPILETVAAMIAAAGIEDMSVSPVQGRFLQVMATACGARNILEIGTFYGYSTVWLARALPAEGKVVTIECDEKCAREAQRHFELAGLAGQIEMKVGKALDVLHAMTQEPGEVFDLIFIDADKPPYPDYLKLALQLSRKGTIIVADNVIRHLYDPATPPEKRAGVAKFNEFIATSGAVTATIVQTVGSKVSVTLS